MTSSGDIAVSVTEASSRVSHLSACSLRRSLRAKASNSCGNLCRFGLVSVGTNVSSLSSTLNSARVSVVPLLLKTKSPTWSSRRRAVVVVGLGFARRRRLASETPKSFVCSVGLSSRCTDSIALPSSLISSKTSTSCPRWCYSCNQRNYRNYRNHRVRLAVGAFS